MHPSVLRARTVPEILDASFQILRRHYPPIITVTAIALLPAFLLAAILPLELRRVVDVVEAVLLNFSAAAVALLVADIARGREPDVRGALRGVARRLWTVLGASILQGVAVLIGLLLLVVPGIVAWALLFAMPMVVMVEGKSNVSEAVGRSAALAKGSMPRVAGILVLTFLIVFITRTAIGTVLALTIGESPPAELLDRMLSVLPSPFGSVVATLLYFDLRIRKEGFGMADLSASLPPSGDELPRPAL